MLETEIIDRLLVELEWAGEENLPTLLNSIFEPTGADEEVEKLRDALSTMVKERLIALAVERNASNVLVELPLSLSTELIESLARYVAYNGDGGHWTGGERPWPSVILLHEGKARGCEILRQRGYRWWRNEATR